VKTYDFIFSDKRYYRISRHVLFWLSWFVFYQLAYHYPTSIFPDWNIKAKMDYATKTFGVDYLTLRGGLARMIWEITYRQSSLLLCHILFTYAIIYFILPRYISNNKKWLSTTLFSLLIFSVYLAMLYFFTFLTSQDTINSRLRRGLPLKSEGLNPSLIIERMIGTVAFNMATVIGIAVAIKLMKRWWLKQKEAAQTAKEKTNAELQLLKAQIHPHFLFNSLNNIYSFALEGSSKAPEMIKKLSGLLQYMLYGCKEPLVPLEKEMGMIEDYISLEKIRYGDRLRIEVQVQQYSKQQLISPLLLVPFVENSFKHGTSKMLAHPYVMMNITLQDGVLYFKLTNSRPSGTEEISENGNRGLGLKNVKKRLELLYPGKHELHIMDDPSSYTIWLKINLGETISPSIYNSEKKEPVYELA
jgi:two-component system, LytTR family, sensor kinase